VIETKWDASDRPGQVVDYWESELKRTHKDRIPVVFIAKNRRDPDLGRRAHACAFQEGLVCLSYRLEFADLLRTVLGEVRAPRVRETLAQYLDLLAAINNRRRGRAAVNLDDELRTFFSDRQRLTQIDQLHRLLFQCLQTVQAEMPDAIGKALDEIAEQRSGVWDRRDGVPLGRNGKPLYQTHIGLVRAKLSSRWPADLWVYFGHYSNSVHRTLDRCLHSSRPRAVVQTNSRCRQTSA
jgi:hypothetical protein